MLSASREPHRTSTRDIGNGPDGGTSAPARILRCVGLGAPVVAAHAFAEAERIVQANLLSWIPVTAIALFVAWLAGDAARGVVNLAPTILGAEQQRGRAEDEEQGESRRRRLHGRDCLVIGVARVHGGGAAGVFALVACAVFSEAPNAGARLNTKRTGLSPYSRRTPSEMSPLNPLAKCPLA
jgi:hypothetical protein